MLCENEDRNSFGGRETEMKKNMMKETKKEEKRESKLYIVRNICVKFTKPFIRSMFKPVKNHSINA